MAKEKALSSTEMKAVIKAMSAANDAIVKGGKKPAPTPKKSTRG